MNRAIRKWQRQRKRRNQILELVKSLSSLQSRVLNTKADHLELVEKLEAYETGVLEQIPLFVWSKGSSGYFAGQVLELIKHDASSGTIRIYMNQYEYLSEASGVRYVPHFVSTVLSDHYHLDDWNLPLERERKIISLIIRLQEAKVQAGSWIVPYIVTNPDKEDRVIDVLMTREVRSAQAMEAFLDDEVPTAIQDGAL